MKVSRSIVLGALAAGGMVLALGSSAGACPADWGDDDWDDDFLEEEGVFYGEYDDEDLNENWNVAHVGHFNRNQEYKVDVDKEDNDTSHSIINVID